MQSQEPLSNTRIDTIEKNIEEVDKKLTENSFCWEMLKQMQKRSRRDFIIIVLLICLWFATVVGFGLYLNQFDFEDEMQITAEQEGDNNLVNGGDLIYGTTDSNN